MIFKKPAYLRNFYLSYLLLMALPALPFLVNAKIQWVLHVMLIFTVIFESKKVQISKFGKWIALLIIPTIWSFYNSLDAEYYNIVQSLFYLLTPYLMIILGIQLGGLLKNENDIFKYIIYHGSVGSALFLGFGLFTVGTAEFKDIYMLRSTMLWGSITNVIAIILLLFSHKNNQPIVEKNGVRIILLLLNILALVLTASRTYYVIFFIFLLLVLFKYEKKIFIITCISVVFSFISIMSIETDNLFIVKIQNAVSEVSNTREFSGYDDVGSYYRAYETQQAMRTFYKGDELELIIGHGLQKLVDLNLYVDLAGTERRFIPVLHNGYAYLLLRAGYLGVVLYCLFFIKSLLVPFSSARSGLFQFIYIGSILSLLISNYVIGSFFSIEMVSAWVIIGVYFIHKSKT